MGNNNGITTTNPENNNEQGNQQAKEGLIKRFQRGWITFKATPAGRVVGTVAKVGKVTLMGLGLVKVGEMIFADKKEEPNAVVVVTPIQPAEDQEPEAEEAKEAVEAE